MALLSKFGDDKEKALIPYMAGGAGVILLIMLFAKNEKSREEVEAELAKQIDDPVQLEEYRAMLDNQALLELFKEIA